MAWVSNRQNISYHTSAPTTSDIAAEGHIWVDTSTIPGTRYVYLGLDGSDAVWREVVHLNEDGDIVGPVIPRYDDADTINEEVGTAGEIMVVSDDLQNPLRVSDGTNAGGLYIGPYLDLTYSEVNTGGADTKALPQRNAAYVIYGINFTSSTQSGDITVPDGTHAGQMMEIYVTPTTFTGTLSFMGIKFLTGTAVVNGWDGSDREYLKMYWGGSSWMIVRAVGGSLS